MKKNLGVIIIALVSGIFALSFLVLATMNYRSSRNSAINHIETSSIPLVSENILMLVNSYYLLAKKAVSVMATNFFIDYWVLNDDENIDDIVQFLKKIKEEYNYTTTFFVSTKTYRYYYNKGYLRTVSQNDPIDNWYFNFLNLESDFEVNIDYDSDQGDNLTLFVNQKVYDSNGIINGVIGISVAMDYFTKAIAENENKYSRRIFLVDNKGYIQVNRDISIIKKATIFDIYNEDKNIVALLDSSNGSTSIRYKKDKNDLILSSKYIEELDWFLILEHNVTNEIKDANQRLLRTIIYGAILLIITILIVSFIIKYYTRELNYAAITDPLTNLFNRREFNRQIHIYLSRMLRLKTPFSIIMIDIDYFKKINDTYGHDIGDNVLKVVSNVFSSCIRSYDVVCRLGGDEFIILLESDLDNSISLVERINSELERADIKAFDGKKINITLSIGIYEAKWSDSIEGVMKKADEALYNAKEGGRNCYRTI